MIMNDVIREILASKPDDEIVVANQKEYFNGAPLDINGNSRLYKEVIDVVRENGKLVILIK